MAKEKYIKPCKITDELYCIGVSGNPSHIITTTDGIVMIDTGCPDAFETLKLNMELLGFDIRDVRHIIHTHGHRDHAGSTNQIVAVSGAKTYAPALDADAIRGKNSFCWNGLPGREFFNAFEPDVLINDGDVLTFGKTKIRFVSTPGHTVGTTSLFWNVNYKGKEYLAGMFGGAGHNTLVPEYLEKMGLDESVRIDYIRSVEKILDEPVDIHIGNHHGDNKHSAKAAAMTEDYNPFIEESNWRGFLTERKETLINLYNIKL